MRGSVTVEMAATPERVWELITDVTRIGRYSPETFEAEWLGGATGPAVGAHFRGHVKRNGKGPTYWSECEVVACEPLREFRFAVVNRGKPVNTWGYLIAPEGDGVVVTESFELANALPLRIYWFLLGWARGKTNEQGMRATLERIKADAENPEAD